MIKVNFFIDFVLERKKIALRKGSTFTPYILKGRFLCYVENE